MIFLGKHDDYFLILKRTFHCRRFEGICTKCLRKKTCINKKIESFRANLKLEHKFWFNFRAMFFSIHAFWDVNKQQSAIAQLNCSAFVTICSLSSSYNLDLKYCYFCLFEVTWVVWRLIHRLMKKARIAFIAIAKQYN